MSGGKFEADTLINFSYYAEIDASTYFSTDECLGWAYTKGACNWQVRYGSGRFEHPCSFHYDSRIEDYERRTITQQGVVGKWEKFVKEDNSLSF